MQPLAEICSLIARHVASPAATTVIPGLRLGSSEVPTEPLDALYEPAFALVAQGTKRTVLADKVYEYSAGQCLVVSADLPVVGQIVRASRQKPYLSFAIALRPEAVASLLLASAVGESIADTSSAIAVSVASADLLDSVTRILRLLDRPSDVAVLHPMLERELLWRLLCSDQGPLVRQIGLADSRLSQIHRAIRWIRAHYAEPLRVEELAQLAAMGASTFHRHFKAVTAMSPLQYQKRIRLLEARTRLMANAKDVAAVGFDVGYESPSQFSREYSRLFGASPGKDAARLRAVSQSRRSVP
jgi:AraC-like DNA-binding protein